MTCSNCCEECPKIKSGRKNATGNIYIDDTNRQWYGNTCPNCRYKSSNVPEYSHRPCGKCKGLMTKDRYFECITCKPELPPEDSYDSISVYLNTNSSRVPR